MSIQREAISPLTLDPITTGAHKIVAFDSTTAEARVIETETTVTNSDEKSPTSGAVVDYVDSRISVLDVMVYKGLIDCSTNPNYPAGDAGNTYRVSATGKIGGASGVNVEQGDILICNTDGTVSGNQATVGAFWNIIQTNLDGAVTAPSNLATDKIVLGGGVNKTVKNSGVGIEFLLPVGSILHFGGAIGSLPTGFLACNGSAVSRTTYNTLFALIGTTFGVGDNSTTFNIPDFQGRSPKGVGTSSGETDVAHVAETITLGTKNNDKFQGHWHKEYNSSNGAFNGIQYKGSANDDFDNVNDQSIKQAITDGVNGTPRTGTTTTGKTLGVNFIIKF